MIEKTLIWLENYIKKDNIKYHGTAIYLINELPNIDNIEQLYHLFYKARTSDICFFLNSDTKDEFMQKRSDILMEISQLKELIKNVKFFKLDKSAPLEIKQIIELVLEILKPPKNRLNGRLFGVLSVLCDTSTIKKIIDHLTKQPIAPYPIQPTPGSFNAEVPRNAKHKSVLQLLRNNSATYNISNDSSIKTNQFLQSLLTLYREIQSPSCPIKPEKSYQKEPCLHNSYCF